MNRGELRAPVYGRAVSITGFATRRQMIDRPLIAPVITEYRLCAGACRCCGCHCEASRSVHVRSLLDVAVFRAYALKQELITPHCLEQNGIIERVIRTLKEQCVHRHRFKTLQRFALAS